MSLWCSQKNNTHRQISKRRVVRLAEMANERERENGVNEESLGVPSSRSRLSEGFCFVSGNCSHDDCAQDAGRLAHHSVRRLDGIDDAPAGAHDAAVRLCFAHAAARPNAEDLDR